MLVLLLFSLNLAAANAQNFKVEPLLSTDWKLLEIPTGVTMALPFESPYAFERSVLYLNEEEAAISVWHNTIGYAMMRIDHNAKVKWKSPVPGAIIGSARWKDKLVAFYTREWDFKNFGNGVIKEVSAIALDLETGKKLYDKVVFRNESKKFIEPCIHRQPDDQFSELLIRQTNNSRRDIRQNWRTVAITLVTLGESLAPRLTELPATVALKGLYVGSLSNSKGEMMIITQADDKLVVERFDSKFSLVNKLEAPADFENRGTFMSLDEQNDQSLIIAIREFARNKINLHVYDYDFTAGKVLTGDHALDKEQAKQWKARNKELGEEVADFRDVDLLQMVGLLQSGDKIIVLFQELWTRIAGNGAIAGSRIGPVVVVFFDRKLKLLQSQAISKQYDIDNPRLIAWTLGAHVYSNKLLLVTDDGIRQKDVVAMISAIDLDTLRAEKPFKLEKNYTEGGATIWFEKNWFLMRCSSQTYKVTGF